MMINGKNKFQEQQKHNVTKEKTLKAHKKKNAHDSKENEKVVKKKKSHKAHPKKDVSNFTKKNKPLPCIKQPESKLPKTKSSQLKLQVNEKETPKLLQKQLGKKRIDVESVRHSYKTVASKKPNAVPLRLPLRNVIVPLPLPCDDDNHATHRTMAWAPAPALEVHPDYSKPRWSTPQIGAHQQGLSALASELPPKRKLSPAMVKTKCDGEQSNCLEKESQKFLGVDRVQWQREEIEKEQNRHYAQKMSIRKKEIRYFRRCDGVRRDANDEASNTIMEECKENKSTYSPSVVKDVEEANTRRELLRKELAQRLLEQHSRKMLITSQESTAFRQLQCSC